MDELPRAEGSSIVECDIVMKGGVTSGIIYPGAISALAKKYRFRGIGGTSAGAIAAAATAAAEYSRLREGDGFEKLARIPVTIGYQLQSLFQPSAKTKPIFKLCLGMMERKDSRIGPLVAIVTAFPVRLGIGLLLPLAVAWAVAPREGAVLQNATWAVFAVVTGIVLAAVLVIAKLIRIVTRHIPNNYFGMCNGLDSSDGSPSLTNWLADILDEIAGLDSSRRLLTFADLWGPTATGIYWSAKQQNTYTSVERTDRMIDLQVMTTDLSHGRPLKFPAAEEWTSGLAFCPAELAKLFPVRVVDHLMRNSIMVKSSRPVRTHLMCPYHSAQVLHYLPSAPDLPVVFAARLSLSFPILISAVPLYEIRMDAGKERAFRCWISDGGLTSNFPVYFFDRLLPRRPTLGINLRQVEESLAQEADINVLGGPSQGPGWRLISRIDQFFTSIIKTMQNWSDEGQMNMKGFSERIVNIYHTKQEGGLNLAMPRTTIDRLAMRGELAGELLLSRFDWTTNRWIRYTIAIHELSRLLGTIPEVRRAYERGEEQRLHDEEQLLHDVDALNADARYGTELEGLQILERVGAYFRSEMERSRRSSPPPPYPAPELRITPRY